MLEANYSGAFVRVEYLFKFRKHWFKVGTARFRRIRCGASPAHERLEIKVLHVFEVLEAKNPGSEELSNFSRYILMPDLFVVGSILKYKIFIFAQERG